MCPDYNRYDALIKNCLLGLGSQEEALELLSWVAESEENRTYFKVRKDAVEVRFLTDFAEPELDKEGVEAALNAVNAKIDATKGSRQNR